VVRADAKPSVADVGDCGVEVGVVGGRGTRRESTAGVRRRVDQMRRVLVLVFWRNRIVSAKMDVRYDVNAFCNFHRRLTLHSSASKLQSKIECCSTCLRYQGDSFEGRDFQDGSLDPSEDYRFSPGARERADLINFEIFRRREMASAE